MTAPGVAATISLALAIAPFMPCAAGREHQFGAEQRQHLAALDRHRFRHDQDELVAARRRDERQRDAGVAGGRLDQNSASGRDLALRLERVDHRDADAVLDAGDRIEEFELAEETRADALFLGDAIQRNERRVADRVGDRGVDPSPARLRSRRSLSSSSQRSP